jgi:hypothetical protein
MEYVYIVIVCEDTLDENVEKIEVFSKLDKAYRYIKNQIHVLEQYEWEVELPETPTLEYVNSCMNHKDTAIVYTLGDFTSDRFNITYTLHKKVVK